MPEGVRANISTDSLDFVSALPGDWNNEKKMLAYIDMHNALANGISFYGRFTNIPDLKRILARSRERIDKNSDEMFVIISNNSEYVLIGKKR